MQSRQMDWAREERWPGGSARSPDGSGSSGFTRSARSVFPTIFKNDGFGFGPLIFQTIARFFAWSLSGVPQIRQKQGRF